MLKDKIAEDYLAAFKGREVIRKDILGMVKSEIKNKEIELRGKDQEVSDEHVFAIIKKLIDGLSESLSHLQGSNRQDGVNEYLEQKKVLESYMPEKITGDDLRKEVEQISASVGAETMKDMGKIMGALKQKHGAAVDMAEAKNIVQEVLA